MSDFWTHLGMDAIKHFWSSTFSACLILLGILLARHCLEEFNRIKGLLFKPKKDSVSAKKYHSWPWKDKELLWYFSAVLDIWVPGLSDNWKPYFFFYTFLLQFGSHSIIPESCAFNYLHASLLKCSCILFEGKKCRLSQRGWIHPGTSTISRIAVWHPDELAGLSPHIHPQPSPCNTNPLDHAESMAEGELWMPRHIIKNYWFYRTL